MAVMEIVEDEVEPGWALMVGDLIVVFSSCHHVCKRYATRLNNARNSSHRAAMQILVEELGFCNTSAEHLFLMLQSSEGRPN